MAEQREHGITWTETTWNPVRGCSRVSPGCERCYAERMAGRFCGPGQPYEVLVRVGKQGARWTGDVRLVPEHLADPLRWRRPRRVFVNSMSDLFHERLSNEDIAAVFGVMAAAPRHQFQVLTKRAERMRDWFTWLRATMAAHEVQHPEVQSHRCHREAHTRSAEYRRWWGTDARWGVETWPLPNVWLGVSVEDQRRADERIPLLLETRAAVRFVSVEPMLGPVSMLTYLPCLPPCGPPIDHGPRVDWVICGCESGPGARPRVGARPARPVQGRRWCRSS